MTGPGRSAGARFELAGHRYFAEVGAQRPVQGLASSSWKARA